MKEKPTQPSHEFPAFEAFKDLPDSEEPFHFQAGIPGFRGELRFVKMGHIMVSDGSVNFKDVPSNKAVVLRHFNEGPLVELNFVQSGCVFQKQSYHRGELLFKKGYHNLMYNCGAWEQNRFIGNEQHHTFAINIHADRFLQLFGAHSGPMDVLVEKVMRQEPFFVERPQLGYTPYMQTLIDSLWTSPLKGNMKKLFLEVRAMELMLLQCELLGQTLAPTGVLKNKSDVEKIHFARELLMKDLQHPPTLAALARLCGLNEFKLKRGYKEVFGATVFGHFNSLRMQQAMQLLRHTDRSITAIAYETGYAHAQHFNRAFKKEFGISPGKARTKRSS